MKVNRPYHASISDTILYTFCNSFGCVCCKSILTTFCTDVGKTEHLDPLNPLIWLDCLTVKNTDQSTKTYTVAMTEH